MTARFSIAVSCILLQACASPPPAAPEPPVEAAPVVVLPAQPTTYENQQRKLALEHEKQGRLADAALVWEVLMTIRPGNDDYRERWSETRRKAALAAAERVQRGDQASARGQLDSAQAEYLAALSLQPDNARAGDALRKIERERNRRNHLGKLTRHTLTRRAMAEAEMSPRPSTGPTSQAATAAAAATPARGEDSSVNKAGTANALQDRIEVEHASLLASQGEFDAAAAMLEPWLANNRRDAAARSLMADILFQQAEGKAGSQPDIAIALLERSLQFDRKNARAAERLKQLKAGKPRKPQ